jgi:hypothetical protein
MLNCAEDVVVSSFSIPPVDTLRGFWIMNTSIDSLSFEYSVSTDGPGMLLDGGDPASLSGVTPILGPWEFYYPPQALVTIPATTDYIEQTMIYHASAVQDSGIQASCNTLVVFDRAETSGSTFFELSENLAADTLLNGQFVVRHAVIPDMVVAGDLNGSLNFLDLKIASIVAGLFGGSGFFEGEWSGHLEGAWHTGEWKGVVVPDSGDARIHLRGAFSGTLAGVCDGFLEQSIPGSGNYDSCNSVWRLTKIGTVPASGTMTLSGSVSDEDLETIPTGFNVHQSQLSGPAYGQFAGPLSAVLTHVTVSGPHEYDGMGFSNISYTTEVGPGTGWVFNRSRAMSEGMFEEPIPGRVSMFLNQDASPKSLSGIIEGLDYGQPPLAELSVDVWGPYRVSPGQTVDYVIQYVNHGWAEADEAILFLDFDSALTYVGSSEGAEYHEYLRYVAWNLGAVPARTTQYRTVKFQIPWGLRSGLPIRNSAYIVDIESPSGVSQDQGPKGGGEAEASCDGALFLNGIDLPNTPYNPNFSPTWKKCNEFAQLLNASWQPVYYTGDIFEDAIHAQGATSVSRENPTLFPTDMNGLTLDFVTNNHFCDCWAYSGGTRTAVTALRVYNLKCDRLVLISPISGCQTVEYDMYKWELEQILQSGKVSKLVIYQSASDVLNTVRINDRSIQRNFSPNDPFIKQYNVDLNPASLTVNGRQITITDEINQMSHRGLMVYLNRKLRNDPDATSSTGESVIATAVDPNMKYGLQGHVYPGQTLDYAIEYENEGEGIAFGVYVTDVLDVDLDATTLFVNNGGTYDPLTRTITWMIGQVNPNEGGTVSFVVNFRGDAIPGTEVINYATVYFPSVPEITRTNAVWSAYAPAAMSLVAPNDVTIPAYSTIPTLVLSGFQITNSSLLDSVSFVYSVATTGPASLSDNGNPESLSGTTPILRPGQYYVPPEAALIVGEIREHAQQEVVYSVSAVQFPELAQSRTSVLTFEPPVSVFISGFSGVSVEYGVELTWDVVMDEDVKGFRIYRNAEGAEHRGLVNQGSLVSPTERKYLDNGVGGGLSYEYALGVVLTDESEVISQTVTVKTKVYKLTLHQNHPNPFNPSTAISFTLPKRTMVTLSIYNVSGTLVATLVDETIDDGFKEVLWDGKDARGNPVSSGVYFYRLTAGDKTLTKKMVLLK